MAKEKPKRDRSQIPHSAAWCALQRPVWEAFRAKRERVKRRGAERKAQGLSIPLVVACVHVGESLTAAEVESFGLNRRRSWHRCEKGLTKNAKGVPGVACSCEGCGPKCEGYAKP